MSEDTEATRLEELWAGAFGDEYLARNFAAGAAREAFWDALIREFPAPRVLEIGCNSGANLQWIVPRCEVALGVDVSSQALDALRQAVPRAIGVLAEARSLPFPDDTFDLVFTSGVLIHQPESSVARVIAELVRVSRRYVLSMEYAAADTEEIPYRGERGALFKRNYESLYGQLFPELRLARIGFLSHTDGWDEVTWWLFEKPPVDRAPGS